MKPLLAVAAALAVLTTGCAVQATRATNVTTSSATLNANVRCKPGTIGQAWWELRQSGGAWKAIGSKSAVGCPAADRTFAISRTVGALSAGTRYEYRVAAQPGRGGPAVFSNASSFATAGAADRFSPGLVSSADHGLSARAAGVLGSDHVRVEFDIDTPVAQMRATVARSAAAGVEMSNSTRTTRAPSRLVALAERWS